MEGITKMPKWEPSVEPRATANITKFIGFANMQRMSHHN